MRHRTIRAAMLATIALCALPQAAAASIDVTSDGAGGIRVTGNEAADTLVLDRGSSNQLRVVDGTGAQVTSSDATCTADVEQPSAVTCGVTNVAVALGGGADILDATLVTGITLTVDGGDGVDTLHVGSQGTATVNDTTGLDVVDLSHATAPVTIRYQTSPVLRLVASCSCAPAWSVRLPANPGTVVLGAQKDRVDLTTWRAYGKTTWQLGGGLDKFFGSPSRKSVVDAGEGNDELVSRAAADVINGGVGSDHIADMGGTGDVLRGGAGVDVISSLDSRRDTVDGGVDRDMCLSLSRRTSGCDTGGPIRGMEIATYFPVTTERYIFQVVGIRG
jgi:Ca2+-binding RTX toxin-like protein